MECDHIWQQVFEESLVIGFNPIGWQCTKCNKFVSQFELSPSGLIGKVLKGGVLYPACGGKGKTSTGETYSKIVDEKGKLTIIP